MTTGQGRPPWEGGMSDAPPPDDPTFRRILPMPGEANITPTPEESPGTLAATPAADNGAYERGWSDAILWLDSHGFSNAASDLMEERYRRWALPDWRHEVAIGDTKLGFDEWFQARQEQMDDVDKAFETLMEGREG